LFLEVVSVSWLTNILDWLSLAKSRCFGKLANAHWHRSPTLPLQSLPSMIEVGSPHANLQTRTALSISSNPPAWLSNKSRGVSRCTALPTSQFSTTLNRSSSSSLAQLHYAVRLPRITSSAVKAWSNASPPALPPSLLSTRILDALHFAVNHSLNRSLSPPIYTICALHKSLGHHKPGRIGKYINRAPF
jgi:hypothetical protein